MYCLEKILVSILLFLKDEFEYCVQMKLVVEHQINVLKTNRTDEVLKVTKKDVPSKIYVSFIVFFIVHSEQCLVL